MTADMRAFGAAPDLLIRLNCGSFIGTRRNPDGAIVPSEDQTVALDTLYKLLTKRSEEPGKRTVLLLTGYAGTGKSTVMKLLMERLEAAGQEVTLLAPTGKAAARLGQTTGRATSTVHGFIYGAPVQVGACPACGSVTEALGFSVSAMRKKGEREWVCPDCSARIPLAFDNRIERELGFSAKAPPRDSKGNALPEPTRLAVAVVDEASMVDEKLDADLKKLLRPRYAVLYVGDKGQLPPVKGKWGPNFDKPDAALTRVHRQAAGNPIVNLATRIREGQNQRDPFAMDVPGGQQVVVDRRSSLQQAAAWLSEMRKHRQDATLISYTNKSRQALNQMVREMRPPPTGMQGRSLADAAKRQGLAFIQADRALIRANNRDAELMNGEVVLVSGGAHCEGNLRKEGFQWVEFHKRGKGPKLLRMDLVGVKYENWRDEMKPYTSEYMRAQRAMDAVAKGFDSGLSPSEEEEAEEMLSLGAEELFDQYGAIRPSDLVHADYGECVTAHTSQGSQWKLVGVVWDYPTQMLFDKGSEKDPDEGIRWAYTAFTRAVENLRIFRVG